MSCRRAWARAGCVALLWVAPTRPLHAQVADSALAARYLARGWTAAAEDELYAQVRRAPEDPAARGALGAYLASRGRFRVGATLLEEARRFGGDPSAVAVRLAPIYHWLRDWDALDALPASPLSGAERARVRWLRANPLHVDSGRARPVSARRRTGSVWPAVALQIAGRTWWAAVDARIVGLELPEAPGARRFGTAAAGEIALIDTVVIGGAVLTNVPTTIAPRGAARLGLDLFALLRPEVSADGDSVWIGRAPRSHPPKSDTATVALGFPGAMFTLAEAPAQVTDADAVARCWVAGHRWWFDATRGVVVRVSGMP